MSDVQRVGDPGGSSGSPDRRLEVGRKASGERVQESSTPRGAGLSGRAGAGASGAREHSGPEQGRRIGFPVWVSEGAGREA
jgi:hypothetical protein